MDGSKQALRERFVSRRPETSAIRRGEARRARSVVAAIAVVASACAHSPATSPRASHTPPGEQPPASAMHRFCAEDPAAPTVRFGAIAMVRVCDEAYVDFAASPDERRLVADGIERGFAHLETVFGGLRSGRPAVFACDSEACVRYFVGSTGLPRALRPHESAPGAVYTAGERPAIVAPQIGQRMANLLAHEATHLELGARVAAGALPTWFDEGLATSVGDHPPCSGVARPTGLVDVRTLRTPGAWERWILDHPEEGLAMYCAARAEVDAWDAVGGSERLRRLLDAVAQGTPFDEAVVRP